METIAMLIRPGLTRGQRVRDARTVIARQNLHLYIIRGSSTNHPLPHIPVSAPFCHASTRGYCNKMAEGSGSDSGSVWVVEARVTRQADPVTFARLTRQTTLSAEQARRTYELRVEAARNVDLKRIIMRCLVHSWPERLVDAKPDVVRGPSGLYHMRASVPHCRITASDVWTPHAPAVPDSSNVTSAALHQYFIFRLGAFVFRRRFLVSTAALPWVFLDAHANYQTPVALSTGRVFNHQNVAHVLECVGLSQFVTGDAWSSYATLSSHGHVIHIDELFSLLYQYANVVGGSLCSGFVQTPLVCLFPQFSVPWLAPYFRACRKVFGQAQICLAVHVRIKGVWDRAPGERGCLNVPLPLWYHRKIAFRRRGRPLHRVAIVCDDARSPYTRAVAGVYRETGAQVVIVSPDGGWAPVDVRVNHDEVLEQRGETPECAVPGFGLSAAAYAADLPYDDLGGGRVERELRWQEMRALGALSCALEVVASVSKFSFWGAFGAFCHHDVTLHWPRLNHCHPGNRFSDNCINVPNSTSFEGRKLSVVTHFAGDLRIWRGRASEKKYVMQMERVGSRSAEISRALRTVRRR